MKIFRIALLLLFAAPSIAQAGPTAGVLADAEIQRLMPAAVFFHGQTAPTQLRNSFGMRFSNEGLMLAGLVDTGGYSSAVREKYQFYLLTDNPLEIGGKHLKPGAYGCGFLSNGVLVVMDLAGNDLFRVPVTRDDTMKRPRPLQMQANKDASGVKLYLGREYVSFTIAH